MFEEGAGEKKVYAGTLNQLVRVLTSETDHGMLPNKLALIARYNIMFQILFTSKRLSLPIAPSPTPRPSYGNWVNDTTPRPKWMSVQKNLSKRA